MEGHLGEDETNFVLECAPLVDEARISETTKDASGVVEAIVESFRKYFPLHDPDDKLPDSLGTNTPSKAPKGSYDPRRKPSLPKKKEEPPKKGEPEPEEEKPEDQPGDSEGKAKEEKPEKEPKEKPGEKPGDKSKEKPEEPEDGESGDQDNESDDAENGSDDSEEDADDGTSGDPGDDSDDDQGEGSGEESGGESGSDFEDESDGSEDKSSEECDPEGTPDDSAENSGSPGSDSEDGAEDGGENGGDDSTDDGFSGETGAPGETTEEELLSGMDSLIEESDAETKAFHEPPEHSVPEAAKEDIEEAVSVGIHKDRKFEYKDLEPDPASREEMRRKLHAIARKTAEEIRKILEGKRQSSRHNLQKGRLDTSALWKTSFKDPCVFLKRDQPSPTADIVIYLLIDASYSMTDIEDGKCRIVHAAEAGMLMHLVCKMLNITHASAAFTTKAAASMEPVIHFKVKSFTERDGRFERLAERDWYQSHMRNNVDGYSIRTAASEIVLRPEENKIMFVISDGNPSAEGYCGGRGVKDTVDAVRETEKKGIAVIGMYIGPESPIPRLIYKNLIILGAGNLPPVIARILKKIITQQG
jgi:hypothetical protein